ncbi:hypothetical protein VTK73DRAFT_1582 [Phialemonium thermophilum]|uniref:Uncharacterized protein n=1 Tax=Phialemonium thermophilum TaxID=223376 RepID=A0ABR3Y311_9PEZI
MKEQRMTFDVPTSPTYPRNQVRHWWLLSTAGAQLSKNNRCLAEAERESTDYALPLQPRPLTRDWLSKQFSRSTLFCLPTFLPALTLKDLLSHKGTRHCLHWELGFPPGRVPRRDRSGRIARDGQRLASLFDMPNLVHVRRAPLWQDGIPE